MSLDDASMAAAVAAKMAKAWQDLAFCCVCVSEIAAGSQVATRRGMPPGTATCHAACQRTLLPNKYLERLAELVALEPPVARAVASRLSVRDDQPRAQRQWRHVEVCARAAAAARDMSDSDWQAALHGRAARARTSTAVTSAADAAAADAAAANAVAEVVAASIAEAVEAVESRVDAKLRDSLAETRKAALEAAREALESARPRLVEVRVGAGPAVLVGRAHRQLEELLLMAGAGLNVWMCGPAGSGKTTAAAQVAKALGRRFLFNGAVDTEYKLAGFVDAQGRVVSAAFREAYVRGGVYLFDEVDASMPSAVLAFNAALSGDRADFPGEAEPVPRHPDLVVLAAANTWGLGGTAEYVGRNRMDAAFLDRFAHLEWAYDETLELALAQEVLPGPQGEAWCRRVQALRAAARRRGLKVVVSPRATVGGCRFLAAGATEEQALRAFVTARLGKQDADALLQEAGCDK